MKLNKKQIEFCKNRIEEIDRILALAPQLGSLGLRAEKQSLQILLRLDEMQDD